MSLGGAGEVRLSPVEEALAAAVRRVQVLAAAVRLAAVRRERTIAAGVRQGQALAAVRRGANLPRGDLR
jgi:hypothetical protein